MIDLTGPDVEAEFESPWLQVGAFSLYAHHKAQILDPDGWLSDEVISVALVQMKRQFPSQQGLNDFFSVRCRSYTVPECNSCVEILNPDCHWVCVEFDPKAGKAKVFDSLNTRLMPSLKRLIMEKCPVARKIEMCRVPQQKNGSDCGLFALAFAYEICSGRDPRNATVSSGPTLRQSLVTLLEKSFGHVNNDVQR